MSATGDLRTLVTRRGPIGAAVGVALFLLGADIARRGLSRVGGDDFGFLTVYALQLLFALYAVRCMGVAIGFAGPLRGRRAASASALLLLVLVMVMLRDVVAFHAPAFSAADASCGLTLPARARLRLVVLAPVLEELLFTGYLFAVTRRRVGDPFAIAFVATLFGLLHLPEGLDPFLTRFVFSVASCVLLRKTSVLWPSIVLHVAGNAAVIAMREWEAACKALWAISLPDHLHSGTSSVVLVLGLAWLAKRRA